MTHQLSAPEFGYTDKRRTSSVANGNESVAAAALAAFASNDDMDAALVTAGYTAKQIIKMTQNDKVYALRQELDPTSMDVT